MASVGSRDDAARDHAGLRRAAAAPPLGLACVYRSANAPVVQDLITQLPEGTPVALWALDTVVPELANSTIGSWPGLRLALLQRCADAALPLPVELYDTTAEQVRLAAAFRAEGLRDWGDLQRDDEVRRPWRRPPRPAVTAVAR